MQPSTPPNKAFWEAVTLVGTLLAVLLLSVFHIKGWLPGGSSGDDGEPAASRPSRSDRSDLAPPGTPPAGELSPTPDAPAPQPATPPPQDSPRDPRNPHDRRPDDRGPRGDPPGGGGPGPGGDFAQPINEFRPGQSATTNLGNGRSVNVNFGTGGPYTATVEDLGRPQGGQSRAPVPPAQRVPTSPGTPASPPGSRSPSGEGIFGQVPQSPAPQRRPRYPYSPEELGGSQPGSPLPNVGDINVDDWFNQGRPQGPTDADVYRVKLPESSFVKPEHLKNWDPLHTGEELATRNVGEQELPEAIHVDGDKSPTIAKPKGDESEEAAAIRREAEEAKEKEKVKAKEKEKEKAKTMNSVEGLKKILTEAQRKADQLLKELEERQKVKQKEREKRKAEGRGKVKSPEEVAAEKELQVLRKKLDQTLEEAEKARTALIEAQEEEDALAAAAQREKAKDDGKKKEEEKEKDKEKVKEKVKAKAKEKEDKEAAKRKAKHDRQELSEDDSGPETGEAKVKDKEEKGDSATSREKKKKKKRSKAAVSDEGDGEESEVEIEVEKKKVELRKKIRKAKEDNKAEEVAELEAQLNALVADKESDKPKSGKKKDKARAGKDGASESEDEEVDSKDPAKPKSAKAKKPPAQADVGDSDLGEKPVVGQKKKKRVKTANGESEEIEDSGDEVETTSGRPRRRAKPERGEEPAAPSSSERPKAQRRARAGNFDDDEDISPTRVSNAPPERPRGRDRRRVPGGSQADEEELDDYYAQPPQQYPRRRARDQAIPPLPPVQMPNEHPEDFQRRLNAYQRERAEARAMGDLGGQRARGAGHDQWNDETVGETDDPASLRGRLNQFGKGVKNGQRGVPTGDGDGVDELDEDVDPDVGLTPKQRKMKAKAMKLKTQAGDGGAESDQTEEDLEEGLGNDVSKNGDAKKKTKRAGADAEGALAPGSDEAAASAEDEATASDHERGHTRSREQTVARRATPDFIKSRREELEQAELEEQSASDSEFGYDPRGYGDVGQDEYALPAADSERPLPQLGPAVEPTDDLAAGESPPADMPKPEALNQPSEPHGADDPAGRRRRGSVDNPPERPEFGASPWRTSQPESRDASQRSPRQPLDHESDDELDASAAGSASPLPSQRQRVTELDLSAEEEAQEAERVRRQRDREIEERRRGKARGPELEREVVPDHQPEVRQENDSGHGTGSEWTEEPEAVARLRQDFDEENRMAAEKFRRKQEQSDAELRGIPPDPMAEKNDALRQWEEEHREAGKRQWQDDDSEASTDVDDEPASAPRPPVRTGKHSEADVFVRNPPQAAPLVVGHARVEESRTDPVDPVPLETEDETPGAIGARTRPSSLSQHGKEASESAASRQGRVRSPKHSAETVEAIGENEVEEQAVPETNRRKDRLDSPGGSRGSDKASRQADPVSKAEMKARNKRVARSQPSSPTATSAKDTTRTAEMPETEPIKDNRSSPQAPEASPLAQRDDSNSNGEVLPNDWMTDEGREEFEREQGQLQGEKEDAAGKDFVEKMKPVISGFQRQNKTPLNDTDAESARKGMAIAEERRRRAEREKVKGAKSDSQSLTDGRGELDHLSRQVELMPDSEADKDINGDGMGFRMATSRPLTADRKNARRALPSDPPSARNFEDKSPSKSQDDSTGEEAGKPTPSTESDAGKGQTGAGSSNKLPGEGEDIDPIDQVKAAARERVKVNDRSERAGYETETGDLSVDQAPEVGDLDQGALGSEPKGMKIDENGIPEGAQAEGFVANHGSREELERKRKKKKDKKDKKEKKEKKKKESQKNSRKERAEVLQPATEVEGENGKVQEDGARETTADPADDSSGKKRRKKRNKAADEAEEEPVSAKVPSESKDSPGRDEEDRSASAVNTASDEANGTHESSSGDEHRQKASDPEQPPEVIEDVPLSGTEDSKTGHQRRAQGDDAEDQESSQFGHEARDNSNPGTRTREQGRREPSEDAAKSRNQAADRPGAGKNEGRRSTRQMAIGMTRKIAHIIRRAPLFSVLTLASVLGWVFGSRQLANLVILSTGSSAVEVPENKERGLDADLEFTSAVATDKLSTQSLSTTGLFFVVNAFVFVAVLVTGLLLSCAVSRADGTRTPSPDVWWRHPIRSTRSVLVACLGVTALFTPLLMGTSLRGPMTILRRATWRTYLRFGMFLLQVVTSVLLIRQSMSFVYLLATGSTTSYSDLPDVAASSAAIASALQGVSPTTAFAGMALVLGSVIPAVALGLYALLHPRPSRSASKRSGIQSTLKSNKTVAGMLKLIGAVVITVTFVGMMYFFGEIAAYATSASTSTTANLIAANGILVLFPPPLGWALMTLWDAITTLRGKFGGETR